MKAIIYEKYGPPDVLQVQEVPRPKPALNEVLVKIHASPINYGDISARNFANIPFSEFNMPSFLLLFAKLAFGLSGPRNKILGSEFSGVIDDIGEKVTKFKKGDPVFGYTGMKMGAHSEYLCMKETGTIALKPANMSHKEASAIPYGGIMAQGILDKVKVKNGDRVLVNGASGGIGSIAVQLLKHYGAEVTGVCSADRMEYVKALGADFVLDYKKNELGTCGKKYDLVFDILGRLDWSVCKEILTEHGIFLLASFKTIKLLQMLITAISGNKKVICAFGSEKQSDLERIKDLVEDGKLKTIVDRVFLLEEESKAHDYYEKKLNRGHVILNIV